MAALGRLLATTAIALALAIAWWTWRIAHPARASWFLSFDSYVYYEPTYAFAFGELRNGRLPLWTPYQHLGSPFFATAQHGLLYPLSVPYLLLPTGEAMQTSAILHLTLAFVGMVALVRAIGASTVAGVAAAIAFAFSVRMAGLLNVPHHLYAAAWMPLIAWLALRTADRPEQLRWGLLLGAALGIQYLGGYPQFVLYTLYLICAVMLWRIADGWRRGTGGFRIAHASAGALAALVAIGVAAPQVFPAYELASRATRGPALTAAQIDPYFTLGGSVATPLLDSILAAKATAWAPTVATAGPLGLVLVMVAIGDRRHRGAVAFFAGLTVLAMLLALGRYTPLFAAYLMLPGAGLFRLPDRLAVLASLGLAVLVGLGMDALPRRLATTALGCLAIAAIVFLVPTFAPGTWTWLGSPTAGGSQAADIGGQVQALGWWMAGIGGLFALAWVTLPQSAESLRWLVPALLFVSAALLTEQGMRLPETQGDPVRMKPALADFLRLHQGFDRTLLPESASTVVGAPPRSGLLERLYVVADRENVYPRRLAELLARLSDPDDSPRALLLRTLANAGAVPLPQGEAAASIAGPERRLLDLLGVRFVVDGPTGPFVPAGATPPYPEVARFDGLRVFRNPEAMPRAFVVHAAEVLPTDRALDRLASPDFDFRRIAILEAPPPFPLPAVPGAGAGSALILAYEPHFVDVHVTTTANALLVLADQWDPGWKATLDDRDVPVQIADYVLRGVWVPPGSHRVRFRYEPASFRAGVAVAGGVALALLVALALPRFRRRL